MKLIMLVPFTLSCPGRGGGGGGGGGGSLCDAFYTVNSEIVFLCHCSTEARVVFPRAPWRVVSQVEPLD